MEYFRSKSQFKNDNCKRSSTDPTNSNSNKKKAKMDCEMASTSERRSKTKIDVGLRTNSNEDLAIQWYSSSSSSCSPASSRHSNRSSNTKRKRLSSGSLDDKDPELSLEGPSAKRQHLPPSCYPQNSDPSSSVPSSVYPSPVDELVNEIDTRSSDCAPPSYSLPTPDSPTSIDDVVVEESSNTSFETVSTTSSIHSDSECNQTLTQESQPKIKSFDDYVTLYDCMTPIEPPELRMCPLPALSWANASDVWNLMCKKDEQASYLRDSTMLDKHPGLQPRMRAILLDWLIEVCEVYKLHRETYYLAVDYLDRYLSTQKRVQKTHLQLIGITCLFIAAKVEEIYPPKIAEFAYVTDGACQEEDILQHEIILLQALDWSISPVTAMGWLGVYMQLNISNRTPASLASESQNQSSTAVEVDDSFIYPQFSGMEFVQTAQLLDLCSLDVGIGNYPYSVIAAAAISHTFNKETALRVSGLDWGTIQPCASWMHCFFKVISEESENLNLMEQNEQIASKYGMSYVCPNIVTDDSHIIQTHTTSMTMFDRASEHKAATLNPIKTEASPATGLKCPEGLLTPPASSRKPLDGDNNDEEDDHHRVQVTSLAASSQRENIENVPNMNILIQNNNKKT